VALNPVIKFTTLFGLLAVQLAVELRGPAHSQGDLANWLAIGFCAVALVFIWLSFYGMRIRKDAKAS
jgi:K(+)-stimulated pyrophosphate-energized sodium pump